MNQAKPQLLHSLEYLNVLLLQFHSHQFAHGTIREKLSDRNVPTQLDLRIDLPSLFFH